MLSINIKVEGLGAWSKAREDDIVARLRAAGGARTVDTGGFIEREPTVFKDQGKALFRWEHELSGEGICDECAPYLYQIGTIEDFGDEPPLHLRCRCYLSPWVGEAPQGDADSTAHTNWLQSLSEDQIASIAGPVRARLVSAGDIAVEELWDAEYKLVPLKRFGYDDRGRRLR